MQLSESSEPNVLYIFSGKRTHTTQSSIHLYIHTHAYIDWMSNYMMETPGNESDSSMRSLHFKLWVEFSLMPLFSISDVYVARVSYVHIECIAGQLKIHATLQCVFVFVPYHTIPNSFHCICVHSSFSLFLLLCICSSYKFSVPLTNLSRTSFSFYFIHVHIHTHTCLLENVVGWMHCIRS